ncbi:hypothetical protein WL555_02910 [Staphylococcus warneri]|uniref:hypothetical protein n=1 Tax=Staphylococcus TaxID=1279 RepID=UPI00064073D5|nr:MULTISPECIES: hypothetical protein [Staphylococcus]MCG7307091.1 hypothetical protein [Staphylococcus warneri]MCM3482249.1 hypothetical protein [Staphylococcus warneri]MCT1632259.1 hypothetical protein [Staphylococcus warneri]MCT2348264.1 hypothetical protein [Staphylococcus warneri]MCV7476662.1 hypothetical protein [Staphylococcus warneri]
MVNEHPLVRMNVLLSEDEQLLKLMKDNRVSKTDEILIFTFDIPDEYQKESSTPFIRLTEIYMNNDLYNDSDSHHYRYLFAVEVFGGTLNTVHEISNQVINIIKSKNGRCYDRVMDKDDEFNLYNNMLKFQILINEEE